MTQPGIKGMKKKDRVIRVADFAPRSLVNGPGVRAVLWVQGCSRRCSGCFNPGFQPIEGGRLVSISMINAWIKGAKGIEGVTFSGGEPFDQAEALSRVARYAHERGLGALIFSGYTYDELRTYKGQGISDLLGETVLLIAGPYEQNLPSPHSLLGSSNQEMLFLTERYKGYRPGNGRRLEFHISDNGEVRVSGFPADYFKEKMLEKML